MAVLNRDEPRQHSALQQCKQAPGFSAENMLKLACLSRSSKSGSPDVTRETFQSALKLLLARGHAVQYEQVAQVWHLHAACVESCMLSTQLWLYDVTIAAFGSVPLQRLDQCTVTDRLRIPHVQHTLHA